MARLNSTQWEQARAEYEVRGVSLGDIARVFGVATSSVSRKAKTEGWTQGKLQGLVEKKVAAIKELAEAETQTQDLSLRLQHTLQSVVQERLQADGLLASLDVALATRGMELVRGVNSPDAWETMTRGRRNLAPTKEAATAATTVHVNQQALAGAVTVPLPTPQPQDALRAALRGDFTGDSD